MKLTSIEIKDFAPIKFFSVSNLSEVVVIGGPNGVGKTRLVDAILQKLRQPTGYPNIRLVVEATGNLETTDWGGRSKIDTGIPGEAEALRQFLQRAQKRGQTRNRVLNFDSARVFEPVQPYSFSWLFTDPLEEDIGWDYNLSSLRDRFRDTVHSLHRKVRSDKERIAQRALELQRAGNSSMPLNFPDPMKQYKEVFSKLLPGKELEELNEQTQQISYRILDSGQRLPLMSLSSGEREIVGILFDFLLRDPEDSVVLFDEPEIHLHPELSYRLLRTLRESGERNQFIFCTHSADIISASLDNSVIFLQPASGERNQALTLSEESEATRILHLLGQSVGVISLGKKIVLIEGERSSLDKQTYGSIIGNDYPQFVLVPAGGRDALEAFSVALEKVLSRTMWGVDFFLLCDGDAAVAASRMQEIENRTGGRLRRLPRYHVENYFLDARILARVFQQSDESNSWLCSAEKIEAHLKGIATRFISHAAALRIAHRVRVLVGNANLMPKGCDNKSIEELQTLLETRAAEERERFLAALDSCTLNAIVDEEFTRIQQSLQAGIDEWTRLIPGRAVLNTFAQDTRTDLTRLKRLYIKAAENSEIDPFADIRRIFDSFAKFSV